MRGRSGRQGDPGESQFYLSLEDELMRRFGSERIKALLDRFKLSEEESVIRSNMFTPVSYTHLDTAFAFFPALISWSAFRVFGGNPVLGIVIGLMMVSPTLPNAWVVAEDPSKAATFFGIFHHVVGFQNSVLPAFFVGLIGAKLEKWLHKKIPDVLDLLLVPLFTLTIMSFLALFIIGPFFLSLIHI